MQCKKLILHFLIGPPVAWPVALPALFLAPDFPTRQQAVVKGTIETLID